MLNNPIIQRYRFSQFRAQQLWIFGTLYAATLLLIFFINTSIYTVGDVYPSMEKLCTSLFVQFSVLQIFILWLFMPMNCSNVVPREIADKSFDFFRMLPLSSAKKAVGILVGRNLFNLLIAAINLCIWLIVGLLADVSINLLLQWLTLLITVTVALNSASLLGSILSYTKTKSTSVPALVLLALFAFGPIVGIINETVNDGKIETFTLNFLNLEIPAMYLVSLYVLVGAIWAFAGIWRRFSYEYEPLFSRKGAFGFMGCYLFMVYALYHHFLFSSPGHELFYSYYAVSAIPLIGICLLSIRSFNTYIEITRMSSSTNTLPVKIFLNSNLFLGILLFSLLALAAGFVSMRAGFLTDYCKLTLYFFIAWLVLLALIEIYAIYYPTNEKIGYLLMFIAGLYLILPMVLSGLFENDYIAMFSPFGFVCSYEMYNTAGEILPAIVANTVLLVPLLLVIYLRYSKIAELRSNINITN